MRQTIIFDLYETLITEWVSEKYTTAQSAQELGIDPALFRSIWESKHTQMDIGELTYEEVLRLICEETQVAPSQEILQACIARRFATKAQCFTRMDSAMLRMMEQLKEKDCKLALCSNCSYDEVSVLRESPLYPYFDVTILSYEVGVKKPSPEIYRLCTDKLGVSPSDCIYIGDGSSRELYGAEEVGMKPFRAVWYLKQYNCPITPMPFPELTAPDEVPALLS